MSRFPPPSVAAACVCALAVAACGSSGPPSHSSSATASLANQDVAYSQCMRSHQVPTFPDPERGGGFPKNQLTHLAASNPQFQLAQRACQQLMPNHVEAGPSPAEVQQALSGMVQFAACMRSHGVRNWPRRSIAAIPASLAPCSSWPTALTRMRPGSEPIFTDAST